MNFCCFYPNKWNKENNVYGIYTSMHKHTHIHTHTHTHIYICCCLPPDRTRHKVSDLKVDHSEDLGEGKIEHEPKLEPCWTMLPSTPAKVESVLHNLEQAPRGIGLEVNFYKTVFMYFKQEGATSTLSSHLLKLIDQFTNLGSNISSTESEVIIRVKKALTSIDKL